MQYFLQFHNQCIGPMSSSQLMSYDVNENTPVSTDGANWRPLYTFPDLMEAFQAKKSGYPSGGSSYRITCGVLALIIGCLGIQYFIIGKTAGGIITILLSLVTCGLWQIVTFVQGIFILTMTDSQFEHKYVNSPSTLPLF